MSTTTHLDPDWKKPFAEAGFTDFDSLWNTDATLVEAGNYWGNNKNKSWSEVSQLQLPNSQKIYLKRQQNHRPGNAIKWFLGYLTFELEWKNAQTLESLNIPCLHFIYFASRKQGRDKQCILVSKSLDGMISLHELNSYYKTHGYPPRKVRYSILSAILKSVRQLHDAHLIHNALKTKHLFINIPLIDGSPAIPEHIQTCFIDLERMKPINPQSLQFIYKDLQTLARKARGWPQKDFIWFLKKYLNIKKLTPEAKSIIRKMRSL